MANSPVSTPERETENEAPKNDISIIESPIATNGDVILVIDNARLQVSSAILSSASPVFKAMLGPNFLEGQAPRSGNQPKEIPLPDDDPEVMLRLCRILHHQGDTMDPDRSKLPETAHKSLYRLSLMADKYDCMAATETTVGYLLGYFATPSIAEELSAEALLYLLASAYTFGHSRRNFALLTRRLIMDYTMSYSSLLSCPAFEVLPASLLLIVEEQRRDALQIFFDSMTLIASERCTSCPGNRALRTDYKFLDAFAKEISDDGHGSWLPRTTSCSLRRALKAFDVRGDVNLKVDLGCSHGEKSKTLGKDAIKALSRKIRLAACGVCLTCFKEGADLVACPHECELGIWTEDDPISR